MILNPQLHPQEHKTSMHPYQLLYNLSNCFASSLTILLISSQSDLVHLFVLGVLVGELYVDIILCTDISHHSPFTTDDFRVVLAVDLHLKLKGAKSLK